MKKKFARIFSVALATVMVLSLAMAFVPVSQVQADPDDLLEWEMADTPSKSPNLELQPYTDIYDFAVGGEDGSMVYAVGGLTGQSGSFNITDGEYWINRYDDDFGSFHGWFDLVETEADSIDDLVGAFWADIYFSASGDWSGSGKLKVFGEIEDDYVEFCGWIERYSGSTIQDAHFLNVVGTDDTELEEGVFTDGDWDADIEGDGGAAFTIEDGQFWQPKLWRSTNGGEVWVDKTKYLQDATNLPAPFGMLTQVAVAPDNEDWLVVGGYGCYDGPPVMVAASKDATSHFTYSTDCYDSTNDRALVHLFDLAVAAEVDSVHNVAAAGVNSNGNGTVFRLEAGKWLAAAWSDTSYYDGWDDFVDTPSWVVTSVAFSPVFDSDRTVVCMSTDDAGEFYIQSGIWELTKALNEEGGFEDAVRIEDTGSPLEFEGCPYCDCDNPVYLMGGPVGTFLTGVALPSDYDGTSPSSRNMWVYVNGYNPVIEDSGGFVFLVENKTVSMRCGPTGNPELASIAVYGTSEGGNALLGTLCEEGPNCRDVQVYRSTDLDICCPRWYAATKPPTGHCEGGYSCGYAVVAWTPDGEKAYATTVGEESAFSMSEDDGKTWNQLGLIDTWIDYLGDVAASSDCSTVYMTSTNIDFQGGCDSVWRSTSDPIGKRWQRVYCRALTGSDEVGLLRLSPDDETGAIVYFGDYGTQKLYYSLDIGQNWHISPSTKLVIQDFAIEDESTVYVLDADGYVSKSVSYGRHPTEGVDTKLGSGHTIAVLPPDNVLVGASSAGKKVAYSDDCASSFSRTDYLDSTVGMVHVAFDSAYAENDTIYAAGTGGIFPGLLAKALIGKT